MGRKRKFDFSNVESFTRCAEGQHTAKIVEVQENTTQAGDDMLTMAFEVIKGESKGAKVFDNFVLTDKALWKLKQLLQVVGVKCDGKIALDLDKLVGKVCDIVVFHEEYNGKMKAKIDEYLALKSSAEDDDEDEDEDEEEPEEKPAKKKAPAKKAVKKSKPEPEEEPEEDEDWDDEDGEDEDQEEEEKPKKKAAKAPTKKKEAPAKKSKKEPEPEDDDDWDDDDEDWDE